MEGAERVIFALQNGVAPREIFAQHLGIPEPRTEDGELLTDDALRSLLISYLSRFSYRRPAKREYIKSATDVVSLIRDASRIVVIIGAGASVGPDFRSPGGLYETIAQTGALEDPYQVFDLDYFQRDPSVFWRFAHMIFPSQTPEHSLTQYFLAELEKRGKLLRLYTQNVDTLEVGIPNEKLRCVHGSWRENNCMNCGASYGIEDLRDAVNRQTVPVCTNCGGQIKPGIVFFGQRTNIEDEDIEYDSEHADLLIVIGTSLRVAPVSYLPQMMWRTPAVLINREPVTCSFNAELLGDCDDVCKVLERELGWREDAKGADAFTFFEPNKFVLPSEDGTGTQFCETSRNLFLVTPALSGINDDFD